jgi:hypothetical protein
MGTAAVKQHGYTMWDLHHCVEREVKRRRRTYPNRVLTHRMDPFDADAEITKMEIIAEHFARLAEQEQLL